MNYGSRKLKQKYGDSYSKAVAKLLAKQMERKAAKTGAKALMTTFSVYNLERNNAFDYSKAEKELGYHTRSYAETLHDEAVWLRAEGKIA